jgi:hypothetical protein
MHRHLAYELRLRPAELCGNDELRSLLEVLGGVVVEFLSGYDLSRDGCLRIRKRNDAISETPAPSVMTIAIGPMRLRSASKPIQTRAPAGTSSRWSLLNAELGVQPLFRVGDDGEREAGRKDKQLFEGEPQFRVIRAVTTVADALRCGIR